MSDLMQTYNEKLNDAERAAIECALDELKTACVDAGVRLDMSDHAARAAESLAVYIVASKGVQS
jgi:hypothetical protein